MGKLASSIEQAIDGGYFEGRAPGLSQVADGPISLSSKILVADYNPYEGVNGGGSCPPTNFRHRVVPPGRNACESCGLFFEEGSMFDPKWRICFNCRPMVMAEMA